MDLGGSSVPLNFSQIDFDWGFFSGYVTARMKDMILDVRPPNTIQARNS